MGFLGNLFGGLFGGGASNSANSAGKAALQTLAWQKELFNLYGKPFAQRAVGQLGYLDPALRNQIGMLKTMLGIPAEAGTETPTTPQQPPFTSPELTAIDKKIADLQAQKANLTPGSRRYDRQAKALDTQIAQYNSRRTAILAAAPQPTTPGAGQALPNAPLQWWMNLPQTGGADMPAPPAFDLNEFMNSQMAISDIDLSALKAQRQGELQSSMARRGLTDTSGAMSADQGLENMIMLARAQEQNKARLAGYGMQQQNWENLMKSYLAKNDIGSQQRAEGANQYYNLLASAMGNQAQQQQAGNTSGWASIFGNSANTQANLANMFGQQASAQAGNFGSLLGTLLALGKL